MAIRRRLPVYLMVIQLVLIVVMIFQINVISDKIGTLTGDVVVADDDSGSGDVVVDLEAGTADLGDYENEFDVEGSPVLGDLDKAKVIIVEFSDFQCPYCATGQSTMSALAAKYGDDIAIVFKHFPLSFHQYAQMAAEASMCADDQDMFWEYHDELFANQAQINPGYLSQLAGELGLDTEDFDTCLETGKYTSKVNEDFTYGTQLGVTGTPGFFVNGELVKGAQPQSVFEGMIEPWL
tara:strand:+ start:3166 stop:3876 length:711 start_codon:yes stop_codon:yes gene_type:complete